MCKNSARIHKNVENAQRLTSHQQRERERRTWTEREREREQEWKRVHARSMNMRERGTSAEREAWESAAAACKLKREREAEWADSEKQLCEHCVCVKHLTAAAAAAEGSDWGSGSSQLSHMCNWVQDKNGKLSSMREGVCEREREGERNSCVLINGNAM